MKMSKSFEEEFLIVHNQLQGLRPEQEDHISQFGAECVVVADGVGAMPHGQVASVFACDTAIWCYKHVRQRPYYWEDKIKLLKRIFRTTNLALWQKRKETGFEEGLASTVCVVILSVKKIWIGAVGDSRAYLIREGLIEELVPLELQKGMHLPMALGFQRAGVVPRVLSETLITGDMVLIATDGVSDGVTEDDLRLTFELSGYTQESCMKSVMFLLEKAKERGSLDNMSVCVIKKT